MTDVKAEAPPAQKFVIPWGRQILHGPDIIRNPKFNKGLAFTLEERRALRIEGLLPPIVISQDEQVRRVLESVRKQPTDLEKYQYLMHLLSRNEKLFYRTIIDNIAELTPIVYTPTVGLACMKFGHVFKTPAGLYITARDKGRIANILANWPERCFLRSELTQDTTRRHVRATVFTDGERILGLGDLGTYGMGIPIGKLALYTAMAGVDPRVLLPITIDVGTNHKELITDSRYTGLKQPRIERKEYDELIDEFINAMQQVFGPYTLLQFEDFGNGNAFRLLEKYKNSCCTFNDDIQGNFELAGLPGTQACLSSAGTAAVVVAGVMAALPLTGKKMVDHTFLFYGAGSAGIGIAHLIAYTIASEEKVSLEDARKRIWLVDSSGLVYADRPAGGLTDEKLPFAHAHPVVGKLKLGEIVNDVKPTCLFGVTAQPQTFTQDVCVNMAKHSDRPLIFALSNPTSKAECTAEQAYTWTNGKCLFASGSPFPPFKLGDQTFVPGQGNNAYIFPGSRRVTEQMFFIAAKTLASMVSAKDLAQGTLYPPIGDIRKCSLAIATAVGEEAYAQVHAFHYTDRHDMRLFVQNLATHMPKPTSIRQFMIDSQFDTNYPTYIV